MKKSLFQTPWLLWSHEQASNPWSTDDTENSISFLLNTAPFLFFFFSHQTVASLLATHVLHPIDQMTDLNSDEEVEMPTYATPWFTVCPREKTSSCRDVPSNQVK